MWASACMAYLLHTILNAAQFPVPEIYTSNIIDRLSSVLPDTLASFSDTDCILQNRNAAGEAPHQILPLQIYTIVW